MADTVHTGSDFLQATTDPRLQLLAFGRQRDGAHLPVEQRAVQRLFQRPDAVTDRRRCDRQLGRRRLEAAQPGSRLEHLQGIEGKAKGVGHGVAVQGCNSPQVRA